MRFIRPKVIGTLRIQDMMAGNLAVVNGIKNSTNKIIIPCRSMEHGEDIIKKIKETKAGEVIHLGSL